MDFIGFELQIIIQICVCIMLSFHLGGLDEAELRTLVEENPRNFDAWTLLIKEIEKTSPVSD